MSRANGNGTIREKKGNTMDDYISKTEAFDIVRFECGEWSGLAKTIGKRFDDLPHADVQPVRHGHWTLQEDRTKKLYGWHICSECGAWIGEPTNYCSNCGADMRGEQNDG